MRCKGIFTPLPRTRLSLHTNYILLMSSTTETRLVREGTRVCVWMHALFRTDTMLPGAELSYCKSRMFKSENHSLQCHHFLLVIYFLCKSVCRVCVVGFFPFDTEMTKILHSSPCFQTLPRCASLQTPVSAQ